MESADDLAYGVCAATLDSFRASSAAAMPLARIHQFGSWGLQIVRRAEMGAAVNWLATRLDSFRAQRRGRQQLLSIANPPKRPRARTSNLYVIEVDFPVTAELASKIDQALQPLREKYGLDFLVLEPGMKMKRWDDF